MLQEVAKKDLSPEQLNILYKELAATQVEFTETAKQFVDDSNSVFKTVAVVVSVGVLGLAAGVLAISASKGKS